MVGWPPCRDLLVRAGCVLSCTDATGRPAVWTLTDLGAFPVLVKLFDAAAGH